MIAATQNARWSGGRADVAGSGDQRSIPDHHDQPNAGGRPEVWCPCEVGVARVCEGVFLYPLPQPPTYSLILALEVLQEFYEVGQQFGYVDWTLLDASNLAVWWEPGSQVFALPPPPIRTYSRDIGAVLEARRLCGHCTGSPGHGPQTLSPPAWPSRCQAKRAGGAVSVIGTPDGGRRHYGNDVLPGVCKHHGGPAGGHRDVRGAHGFGGL